MLFNVLLLTLARSPVFRAMFNNSLTEQLENRIVIEDINYDVIKEMLHFMYTTRASTNIANLADGLLIAAEKVRLLICILYFTMSWSAEQ